MSHYWVTKTHEDEDGFFVEADNGQDAARAVVDLDPDTPRRYVVEYEPTGNQFYVTVRDG